MTVKKSAGFSLIEVMIAVGLLAILGFAFTSMLINQQKEVSAVGEKMLSQELKTQLTNLLVSPSYCSCLMRGYTLDTTTAPMTLNPAMVSIPNTFNQPPPALPAPCVPAGGDLIPPVGMRIAGSNMMVGNIGLVNIIDQGGGYYTGTISVNLNPVSLVRAIKPIDAAIGFSVNVADPPNAKSFLSCGVTEFKTMIEPRCRTWTAGLPACIPPACPAGWTDLGVISRSLEAANAADVGGYESRFCTSTTSYLVIEPKCRIWTGGFPVCAPPACPAGWTDLGIISSATVAANGPDIGGYMSRFCVR